MTAEHAHGIDTGGVHLLPEDLLTEAERGELERLRHNVRYYPENVSQRTIDRLNWLEVAAQRDALWATRQTAADTILAEARRLCCGNNPSTHHAASAKHSERMAFAGDLARAVRGA